MTPGQPLPMALREGARLGRQGAPLRARRAAATDTPLDASCCDAAQVCDGLVKGLKHPDWPVDPWDGLKRLVLMLLQAPRRRRPHAAAPRLRTRLALPA